MKNTGHVIKDLLKAKGLNQKQLADMLKISPQAVTDWVKGRANPDIRKLPELAKILGTSIDTFIPSPENQAANGGRMMRLKIDYSKAVSLPLISIKGQANIIERSLEGCQIQLIEDTYQLFLPDLELNEDRHCVIEIEGDSMEPDIKNRAKVLGEKVTDQNIQYESNAVYAILYAHRFVVKRIKSNDIQRHGYLVLHSDNARYGPMTIEANEIRCMWKIIRIVDSPVY